MVTKAEEENSCEGRMKSKVLYGGKSRWGNRLLPRTKKFWSIRWNFKIGKNVETTKYLEINEDLKDWRRHRGPKRLAMALFEDVPRGGQITINIYCGVLKLYFWG